MTDYNKRTIKELRVEMTKKGVGYMSNWTKPVLIKRLEEEDKWILSRKKQQDNQMVGHRSFEEQLIKCQKEFDKLGIRITSLAKQKNALAIERAELHEKIQKLQGVIELTKPTF